MNINNNNGLIISNITNITSNQQDTLNRIIGIIERGRDGYIESALRILKSDRNLTDEQKEKIRVNITQIKQEKIRNQIIACSSFDQKAKYAVLLKNTLSPSNPFTQIHPQVIKKVNGITKDFFEHHLPDEILFDILSYLKNAKDVAKFGLTNHRISQRCFVESSIWKFLLARDFSMTPNCETGESFKLYRKFSIIKHNMENNHYTFRKLHDPWSLSEGHVKAHGKGISSLYVDQHRIYSAASSLFKIWDHSGSVIARYECKGWHMSKMVGNEDRLYVSNSKFRSNIQYIQIHDLQTKEFKPIKKFSTDQDFRDFNLKIVENNLYTFSGNQVKIWDRDGNLLQTMRKKDLDQDQLKHLTSTSSDQNSIYSYSISRLEHWTGGSVLKIKDAKTQELIQTIDSTDYYNNFFISSHRTCIEHFYVYQGCIYLGMNDGQIKIYDFSIPTQQFAFFDFLHSKI